MDAPAGNASGGKKPWRVLVFPCGTEIGLEIHRALSHSTHVELVGASSVASHHGRMVYRHCIEGLPFVGEEGIFAALNEVIAREQIDLLFPAHDDAVLALAGRDELHCAVVSPPRDTCLTCRSKLLTHERFRGLLPLPVLYDLAGQFPLPVFLKPEWGQGSKGVLLAHSHAQVAAALERDPSLLAFEYLSGAEYTVDCFSDTEGQLRFVGPRERLRTVNGISVHTSPVEMPEAERFAAIINREVEMRGAWFFQLKRDHEGELKLLEIGPRVSGGMGLWRAQGINLPLLAVFDAMGQPVHLMRQHFAVEVDRALQSRYNLGIHYGHVYMDFDDTFSRDGHCHPLALMLLAQSRARGICTHLVSRHAGNLEARLGESGLRGLFDTVKHLREGEPKSGCIAEPDAIFIDDSFAERREVHETCGIPVFAVDAIEALLDWRA